MSTLVALTTGYLGLLFLVAWVAERGARRGRSVTTGTSLSLALGVYATSWTYYGSFGFAARNGLVFLAVYVGATLACLLGPVLWEPLLRVCRTERLHSLADVFAFRFRSQAAGALTAGFALLASVPYLAQQIRALSESAAFVTGGARPTLLGLAFSVVLAVFAALFGGASTEPGARGAARSAEQTRGLVVAIAFESVVKLAALSAAAVVALFVVFQGPRDLWSWLSVRPFVTKAAVANVHGTAWPTLVLLSMAAGFLLPRQFHVAFASAPSDKAFRRALAGFPFYLLVLNLGVLPISWAAQRVAPDAPADFASLAVPRALGMPGVELAVYVGGVSAGSAMVIVTTVALVRMVVVHILLPSGEKLVAPDLYRRLAWLHRVIAATVVLVGYLFFLVLGDNTPLVDVGMVSLVAFAQFMPGLVAAMFFAGATRAGFIAGLLTGIAIWAVSALGPLLGWVGTLSPTTLLAAPEHESVDPWTLPTFFSLGANILVFAIVSMRTRPTQGERDAFARFAKEEQEAAQDTRVRASMQPGPLPETLEARLAPLLGRAAAQTEIRRTMEELSLDDAPLGAAEADLVRRRLEMNLSDLLGPVLARRIVEGVIEGTERSEEQASLAQQLRSIDEALEHLGPSLQGPAAELDVYRRYLRAVLDGLPVGVCAIARDETVVLWNAPIAAITGIEAIDIVAQPLEYVPSPLREVLVDAVKAASDGVLVAEPRELTIGFADGATRSLVVHASALDPALARAWSGSIVAVVEDVTDRRALEAQLVHRDRLATIGRIAAGVAHEIGNPLTGIAFLVQNLRREKPAAEFKDRLDMVLSETRRIDGIVRGLLSYTRKDEGEGSPDALANAEPVVIADIAEEAFRLVRFAQRGDNVTLESTCAPDAVTIGDPKRLTQVLVNLVGNAIDATKESDGRVVVASRTEKGRVVVTVEDNGAGIPEHALHRVFEPFFSTKGPGQGTGLGLWLVYNIVHEHNGEVTVTSEPGKGTTFTLRLPRAPLADGDTTAT